MSQPVSALTQLFPSSLRAWQARWKATQEDAAGKVLVEPVSSVPETKEPESTVQPKRRRKRSGRLENRAPASRA